MGHGLSVLGVVVTSVVVATQTGMVIGSTFVAVAIYTCTGN